MNSEYENRAYPCDEPKKELSFGRGTAEEAFSYAKNNAAFPADDRTDARTADGTGAAQDTAAPVKGKGRRGGNAAASIVIHSGKLRDGKSAAGRRGSMAPGTKDRVRTGPEDKTASEDRRRAAAHGERRRDSAADGRDSARGSREAGKARGRAAAGTPQKYAGKNSAPRRELSPETVLSRAYATRIVRTSENGAFVAAPDELRSSVYGKKLNENGLVLLPFAEQLGRPQRGEDVNVYFYEDKGGRIAATMRAPILRDGEVGVLTVAAVTRIGVFLDNGVPKQILLPFSEQIVRPEEGDEVLVYVYSDKSGRQAATMRVYSHLDKHSPYKEDDRVTGFVYEINPDLGIFVAVDNKYYGLVPIRETFKEYEYGDEIEARVSKVREDGKLDLLIRDKLYKTVQEDADVILYELRRNNGFLPYGDRADAAFIEETYAMSKNQFKRALGHLYKNRIVELDRAADTVRLLK